MSTKFRVIFTLLISFSLLSMATVDCAYAQYNSYSYSSSYYNNITGPAYHSSQLLKNQARDRLARLNRGDSTDSSTPKILDRAQKKPVPTAPNISRRSLPYDRDFALSEKIKENFLQDFAKQLPNEINDIRRTLEKNDLVNTVAALIQREGLDSGSMEGFIAFWYGQSWAVANQKPLPSSRQYQGISQQLHASAGNTQLWEKMTNREKQEFFEKMAYPLVVQKLNYQMYTKQGKNSSIARMASFTQEGLKKFGLNLQRLTLADDGFGGL